MRHRMQVGSCVINIWMAQYRLQHVSVIRLMLQTNATMSGISESCL